MEQPVYTFDTSFLALIISVIALISPIITAVIKNCHETKMREIEAEEERYRTSELHKRQILEEALENIGKYISFDRELLIPFAKSCLIASAYVDHETAKVLEQLYMQERSEYNSADDEQIQIAIAGIKKALSELNKS